jgi:hypothetical protein
VLIVRSFAAEAKRTELGDNPRTYAHVVALCPIEDAQGAYLDEMARLSPGMADGGASAECLLYLRNFSAASDRDHFIHSADLLV